MSQSPPTPDYTNVDDTANRPLTQGGRAAGKRKRVREYLQVWMQDLPTWPFTPADPDPEFQLIKDEDWKTILSYADEKTKAELEADKQFLDYELLRLFRERDHEAKKQQNSYRLIQIAFMLLAAIATVIGALQALALSNDPAKLPTLAFFETLVALLATFLATISGREPPLPIWLNSRRRAEALRREYFRYMVNLPPYDSQEGFQRQMLLSKRAADVNRGVFPEEPID